jgi:hypothetical protein
MTAQPTIETHKGDANMSFLRIGLLVVVTTVTVGLLGVVNSAQAQNFPTYDGARFIDQSPETQALFTATWGSRAEEQWAGEHNAQLVAMGFPVPQPQVAAAPIEQSGAQVSDDSDDDDDDSDDNENDNEESDDNDNADDTADDNDNE